MLEQQSRYAVLGSKLKAPGKLTRVTQIKEKVLLVAYCPKCGKAGMAFQDPDGIIIKPHFCIKHNPAVKRSRETFQIITKICKYVNCKIEFNNNVRNAHKDSGDYCSNSCYVKDKIRSKRMERRKDVLRDVNY